MTVLDDQVAGGSKVAAERHTARRRSHRRRKDTGIGRQGGGVLQTAANTARSGLTRTGSRGLRQILVGVDALAVALTWLAVLAVGRAFQGGRVLAVLVGAAVIVTVSANALQGLYRARVCAVKSVERARVAWSAIITAVALREASSAAGLQITILRAVFGAVALIVVLLSARAFFSTWLRACRALGRFTRPVVLIGVNEETAALIQLIDSQPELGYRVAGVIGEAGQLPDVGREVAVLGPISNAAGALQAAGASGAIVVSSALGPAQVNGIVRSLHGTGAHVQLSSGLSRMAHRRLRAQPFSHETLFYVEPIEFHPSHMAIKRLMDVVLSSTLLLISAPIMVVAALGIKLQDRGPILFRQERSGKNGRTFSLYKLRTMVPDASARLAELLDLNERRGGPLFKLSSDPRVTRLGRILRATSIDELPQLFNVLRGDMSLVGPRPAMLHEVAAFDDELGATRKAVTPGITGLWQVEARDNPSFHTYRNLDLFYIENWSVALDMAILAETVTVVIARALRPLTVRHLRRQVEMAARSNNKEPARSAAAVQ